MRLPQARNLTLLARTVETLARATRTRLFIVCAGTQTVQRLTKMSSKQPSYTELERPVKLDDVVKEQYEDCTPCRLMGSAAFTGLGIYTFHSGRQQLQQREAEILRSGSKLSMGARRMGLAGLSATMVAIGIYRLVN